MVVGDWEFEYNSLTFGGALDIGVREVEGLDPPEFKSDIVPKTGAHGSFTFAEFYHERHIIFQGDIVASTPAAFEGYVNTLRTTFVARSNDLNLFWKYPSMNRRRTAVRPYRLKIPIRRGYDILIGEWVLELVGADPAIFDDVTSTKLFDG